jgi:hypothetical protein
MRSLKVPKRLLFVLTFVCCISILVMAYLIAKPQRDAAHLVRLLEQVQVGRTRIEDIAPALRSAGAVAGVKGGKCEADLNRPLVSQTPRSSDRNGGSPLPGDGESECGYNMFVDNKLLHGLKLASRTDISIAIGTSDGTVNQILFFYQVGEYANIGLVKFIQVASKASTCGRDTCVRRFYGSDGALIKLEVWVSADAPSAERNRLLSIDTSCFSRIGGCKNASELLPISEHD